MRGYTQEPDWLDDGTPSADNGTYWTPMTYSPAHRYTPPFTCPAATKRSLELPLTAPLTGWFGQKPGDQLELRSTHAALADAATLHSQSQFAPASGFTFRLFMRELMMPMVCGSEKVTAFRDRVLARCWRIASVAGLMGLYLRIQAGVDEKLLSGAVEFHGSPELSGVGDSEVVQ
jgi:hypothetical protein